MPRTPPHHSPRTLASSQGEAGHGRLIVAALALIALVVAAAALGWPARAQDEGAEPALTVGAAWARATPPNAPAGAAYATIRNGMPEAVRLIGAESPAAGRVELHETIRDGDVMRMRPLTDGLEVPPGGQAMLEPGGPHIMLMMLDRPLVAGERVDLTLIFDDGHRLSVSAPIQPITASGPPQGD